MGELAADMLTILPIIIVWLAWFFVLVLVPTFVVMFIMHDRDIKRGTQEPANPDVPRSS